MTVINESDEESLEDVSFDSDSEKIKHEEEVFPEIKGNGVKDLTGPQPTLPTISTAKVMARSPPATLLPMEIVFPEVKENKPVPFKPTGEFVFNVLDSLAQDREKGFKPNQKSAVE